MKLRRFGGGAGILMFVWGCTSDVTIGHGESGGGGGVSGSGGTLGKAGSSNGGTTGLSGASGASGGSKGLGGGGGEPPQLTTDKLDLLFVVDNSMSMGDKQALLSASVGSFLRRLENPLCVGPNGAPAAVQPATSAEPCAAGSTREFASVQDMHVGVITSSLGARGGQVCLDADASDDDRAQLLPSVRQGVPSYDNRGFLKWDPNGTASPPGEASIDALAANLSGTIAAANENGCGYEAPLEAFYQFLIDPDPTTDIANVGGVSTPMSTNDLVLAQRAAFLRPDSAVAIVVVSDENDCSIIGNGVGWLVGLQNVSSFPFTMPRATLACQTDPNSPCCRSCASAEPNGPPAGCTTTVGQGTGSDPQCQINGGSLNNSANEDQLNLRCFDQKRRFGFDLLYPIARYTNALRGGMVPNRQGAMVPNPLFAGPRNPSLVSFGLIAGVPWQDISANPPGDETSYLSAAELTAQNRWQVILGDPATGVPPSDPLLVESPNPRTGTSPIIGIPLAPPSSQDPTANPINGHEQVNLDSSDLQYSCIFELPTPRSCVDETCDCGPGSDVRNRPLCQPPGGGPVGSTQYYGKAYPPTRGLALARSLGNQSVLGSICPRNPVDDTRSDYAYGAEFASLARRLGVMLVR